MGTDFVEFRQLQEVGIFSYLVYFLAKSHFYGWGFVEAWLVILSVLKSLNRVEKIPWRDTARSSGDTARNARATWLMSRDTVLYRDRGGLQHGRPRHCDTAPQRARECGDTIGRCLRYGRRGYDTGRPCARRREQQVPYDTAPMLHDTAPMRHDTAPMRHDTAPMRHDTAPMRHDTAPMRHDTAPMRHDTAPMRHDMAPMHHNTTDASLRHDHDMTGEGATIRSGCSMRAAWAMGVCTVHSTQF